MKLSSHLRSSILLRAAAKAAKAAKTAGRTPPAPTWRLWPQLKTSLQIRSWSRPQKKAVQLWLLERRRSQGKKNHMLLPARWESRTRNRLRTMWDRGMHNLLEASTSEGQWSSNCMATPVAVGAAWQLSRTCQPPRTTLTAGPASLGRCVRQVTWSGSIRQSGERPCRVRKQKLQHVQHLAAARASKVTRAVLRLAFRSRSAF